MEKKDIEAVRRIFETQLANGNKFITLNVPMFRELLEHAETHNAIVEYGGKLPVSSERD